MIQLVLSLFPGADLLGLAFELEGFTVVQGLDVIFGRDIRNFHVPAGRFDGVIGGPPCQVFSELRRLVEHNGHTTRFGNLIPEYERVVGEAHPGWFVMENVPAAPEPSVPDYYTTSFLFNNRWTGADQNRVRRFTWGTTHSFVTEGWKPERALRLEQAALESAGYHPAVKSDPRPPRPDCRRGECNHPNCSYRIGAVPKTVTSSDGGRSARMVRYKLPDACKLQGLPEDFLEDAPFTAASKLAVVANGVPLPMGRAVARAVKRALGIECAA